MGCELITPANTAKPNGVEPANTAEISKIESQQVSIAQIFADPDKYNGKIVTFDGYLFSGWEWFGIAENYEYDRVMKSKGEWINIRGEPSVKVNQEEIRRNLEEIREQLYVSISGAPWSLFGKVRITGEFQLIGDKGQQKQVALIVMELLPWLPPQGSTAPVVEGELTLSDSPILNKPIQVVYNFWMPERSMWDNADAVASIEIPSAFELVDGVLQWQGNLKKGSKVELRATIKAVKKGTCEITAGVSFPPSASLRYGNSRTETIYALILSDRGFFSGSQADLPGEGGTNIGYGAPAATSDDIVILLDLSLPHPPALGETAELTLTATAMLDAPGTRINIQLPDALSLVSGDLVWTGDMVKGDRVELKAMVKATAVGKWTIFGSVSYMPTPKSGRALPPYMMILYVFEDGADTLEIPPPEPLPKLDVNLSLSNLPALHEQAELTWRIVAINGDLPKARAQILLQSNEFKTISGNTRWEGELRTGIPIEVKVVIEPRITGVLEMRADVSYWDVDIWSSFPGSYKSSYLQVTEDSAVLVPPSQYPQPTSPTPITPVPPMLAPNR